MPNMPNSKPASSNSTVTRNVDVLLNPANKEITARMTESKISEFKSVFGRIDRKVALSSLFTILWYATLPCFDLKGVTSAKDGEKALLKTCIWKGTLDMTLIFTLNLTTKKPNFLLE
jgi:hypothetical protein